MRYSFDECIRRLGKAEVDSKLAAAAAASGIGSTGELVGSTNPLPPKPANGKTDLETWMTQDECK